MKKRLIKLCIILLCLILFIIFLVYQHKKKYPGERTDFASIEEFEECGGNIMIEIPEGASDIKFYLNDTLFVYQSMYSFVLSDEEEFDVLMESIKNNICDVPEGIKPEWDLNMGSYTDEELEEMAYLEEHYSEMDYKEILSMSEHQYGFFAGYGAKASDYTNVENSLIKMPMQSCFKYVEEGSIEDYTIMYYRPSYGNTSSYGVMVDVENRKFIAFYQGTLR